MTKPRTAIITPYCRTAECGSIITWAVVQCPCTLTTPGKVMLMGRREGACTRECYVMEVKRE